MTKFICLIDSPFGKKDQIIDSEEMYVSPPHLHEYPDLFQAIKEGPLQRAYDWLDLSSHDWDGPYHSISSSKLNRELDKIYAAINELRERYK